MIVFYVQNGKYYVERVFGRCPLRLTPDGLWQLGAHFYDTAEEAQLVEDQYINKKPVVTIRWNGTYWVADPVHSRDESVILHYDEDIMSDDDLWNYFPHYYPVGTLIKWCEANNITVKLEVASSGDLHAV